MTKPYQNIFGKSYQVVDVWHALIITAQCWFFLGLSIAIGGWIFIGLLAGEFLPSQWVAFWFFASLVFALPFGFKVWNAQSAGIYIDPSNAIISFSADDLENSLHEIITLQRFFGHAQRISIAIADIARLDNDNFKTGRGIFNRRCFGLNISGDFGSYQLMFSHKQKRDECRTLLTQVMNRVNGKLSKDHNIAFPY